MKKRYVAFILSLLMVFSTVTAVSAYGVTEGTADATREYAIAAFIDAIDLLEPSGCGELSSFTDAQDVSEIFSDKLAQAVECGIVKGYEDNTLRPQATICRIEALTLLARMLPETEKTNEPIEFTDVPEWAKASIDRLSTAGIVYDSGNGLLGAYDKLTVEQVEALTERVGGYKTAVYLGVENYGAEQTNRSNMDNFRYRFNINGNETVLSVDNGQKDEKGNYDYAIQNILKENYTYKIKIEGDKVVSAKEICEDVPEYTPPVSGIPGERTLLNFLKTAMEPVGTTLYVYGGGWDWQDAGSSIQIRKTGVSPDWVRFFNEQDENYTYRDQDGDKEKANPAESFYPYGRYNEYYYAGLDCSGYVSWVIYNTFETEDMKEGYIRDSMGSEEVLMQNGSVVLTQDIFPIMPGEIMSLSSHIWISLGTCDDGSVLILHSTPSKSRTNQPGGGVQIGAIGTSRDCEAYRLADKIMSEYYPKWYSRYPVNPCNPEIYFSLEGEGTGKLVWSADALADPENVYNMTPEEIMNIIF